jgi:hypothetical protein
MSSCEQKFFKKNAPIIKLNRACYFNQLNVYEFKVSIGCILNFFLN